MILPGVGTLELRGFHRVKEWLLFVPPKMALQKSEDEKLQKKTMEKIYEEMRLW